MATSKAQSIGSVYINTVIGTLAVDGWVVTFVNFQGLRCGTYVRVPVLVFGG